MIKGIYIIHRMYDENNLTGIDRKVKTQIKNFNNEGLNCQEYIQKKSKVEINERLISIIRKLPFSNIDPHWEYNPVFETADYIYMRRPAMTRAQIVTLRKIRKKNFDIKILIEIPTYPYDNEFIGFPGKLALLREKYYRNKLHKYIDRLVIVNDGSAMDPVWRVPVIPVVNGCDVDNTVPVNNTNTDGYIHLICVSTFSFWNGYERLLKGLSEYYNNGGKNKFIIDMVGDGPELCNYKSLVASLPNISPFVKFHGWKNGQALDEIYNKADFGVAALGMYKWKGVTCGGYLKSREYLAKGLPIICAGKVDVLDKNKFEYFLEYDDNASSIDFTLIDQFYEKVHQDKSKNEISEQIRRFAKDNIDISITMKPIINYIKEK